MADKTALLLIADENANRELVAALGAFGVDSFCLNLQDIPPPATENLHFDYLFIDENRCWTPEVLAYVNKVKRSGNTTCITLLSGDCTSAETIPLSDAYLSLPLQDRLIRAVLENCKPERYSRQDFNPNKREENLSYLKSSGRQIQGSQTKTALQLSEQKYRVLFNAMREGLVLHDIVLDENGNPVDFRYIDVNPVFERLTGLQREEVVGKLLSQTPLWYDADWPGDYLKVARSGRSYRVEIYVPELDRHFDIVAFRPQAGQCAAIISDITVRKVHEKEIEGVAKHSSALRSVETPAEITRATLHQINDLIKTDRSLLALAHPKTKDVIIRGATGQWSELIESKLLPDDSIASTILSSGDLLYRDDLSEEETSILAKPTSNLAFLGVPLIVEGSPIGFLAICRESPFTTAEIYSVTAIAENTASAIRRSILLEQTQLYAEQMKTVSEIGRSLVEILDLPTLYSRLCTAVDDLLEGPDSVVLWLLNSENELIPQFAVKESQPLLLVAAKTFPFSPPSEEAVKIITESCLPYIKNLAPNSGEKAEILVPIFSKGKNLGALFIQRSQQESFDETDAKLLSLVAHMGAIAIENARLLDATQLSLRRLTALHTIDTAVSSSLDLQLMLNVILDQLLALLGIDAADILLFDPITHGFKFAYGRGFIIQSAFGALPRFEEKFSPLLLNSSQTFTTSQLEGKFFAKSFKRALVNNGVLAYTLIPLVAKGQIKGILEIYQRKPALIDAEWQDFLETLAGQAAIAIDNAALFKDLQRSNLELTMAYDTTLEGWSFALDLRNKETERHTRRVTALTLRLSKELGIGEEELVHIRRGALLHDIGKMGIPDGILLKPGPLTPEERAIMCKHPVYAYEMLSRIDFLGPAIEIPYNHHEKWDGTGYPNGLKGEQIPLSARIFAIVDVWDSLVSDRPYRAAWSTEKTIEYIQEMAGSHFDPAIVNVFLKKHIWADEPTEL